MRVLVTPAVYPLVFEILTTLTCGALGKKNHIVSTEFETIAKTKNVKKERKKRCPRAVSNVSSIVKSTSTRSQVYAGFQKKKKAISVIVDKLPRKNVSPLRFKVIQKQ